LQAFVSEPVKPMLDTVLLYLGTGTYVSQSDKGELVFGGGLDRVPTHGQRGNLPAQETVISGSGDVSGLRAAEAAAAMGGGRGRGARQLARDRAGRAGGHVHQLRLGHRGLQGDPGGGLALAHLMATGGHHEISRPFDLDRFARGRLIDEAAGSGIAH
jgi:sarcosine oxidase subunit beta